MQTTDRQRLVAHIAQASDKVNLTALLALDETPDLDDAGKLVRGLITEHLYDKHPQVKIAYDAWAEDLDDERTGSQVIARVLSEHVREATTSTDLLIAGGETQHEPGLLLADCSCGDTYTVPSGGDEYAALESAHADHVRTATA